MLAPAKRGSVPRRASRSSLSCASSLYSASSPTALARGKRNAVQPKPSENGSATPNENGSATPSENGSATL